MKNGFVKSSPSFFRLINASMILFVAVLFILAFFIPAPLQEQATIAHTPNPSKSAWFLLWIQELVSWSGFMIYPVILLACIFVLLPWLPVSRTVYRASWFPKEQIVTNVITVLISLFIAALTVIAFFFRGANWSLLL